MYIYIYICVYIYIYICICKFICICSLLAKAMDGNQKMAEEVEAQMFQMLGASENVYMEKAKVSVCICWALFVWRWKLNHTLVLNSK